MIANINTSRFTFRILAVKQTKKRLFAEANVVPSGSSKLAIPSAYTFTVKTVVDTLDRDIELALLLSIMLDDMRKGLMTDEDDKEDFYNND